MTSDVVIRPPAAVVEEPVLSGTIIIRSAAERRFAQLQDTLQDLHIVLIEAVKANDWQALGYPDLATWYRDATAGQSVSPQARAELALLLRLRSYSLQAIGGVLRVAKSTVASDLNRVTDGQAVVDRVTGVDGVSYPARQERGTWTARESRSAASSYTASLRRRGNVRLPREVQAALHLQEGDDLQFTVTKTGSVYLVRVPGAGS